MKYKFRDLDPVRTCVSHYKDYRSYKDKLKEDFHGRCAYCNLDSKEITTPFEIDHFIPNDVFKNEWPELKTTYENLVYSCKKCNRAKGDKFKGEISRRVVVNELFYDPVKVDYNKIFYRNEKGEICSEDKKGGDMIVLLNLYRPIHSLAWVCERIKVTIDKLRIQMDSMDKESLRYKKLKEVKFSLLEIEHDYKSLFIASYNE